MNIQNVGNLAQAPQPARYSSNSPHDAVAVTPARTGVAVELPQVAQQPSAGQLKSAVDSANKMLKQASNNLEFSVDADTHTTVVKLVDTETGDVIRQFPSKEMLAIARSIDQIQQGLLLKNEA